MVRSGASEPGSPWRYAPPRQPPFIHPLPWQPEWLPHVAYHSGLSRIYSTNREPELNWPQLYFGVALSTMATLLLELSLTRIFSVVFYYHFAFLAISIALFGLGVGGVFSYVVGTWRGSLFSRLGTLSTINSAVVVLSMIFVLSRSGDLGNVTLGLVYIASALPFFLAGTIISMAIDATIQNIDRVYFFDLIGAAAGCLALIPLLNYVGGPNTVIVVAILFAVAAAVWFRLAKVRTGRATAVVAALLLVAVLIFNLKFKFIDVHHAKGQNLTTEVKSWWNSFSRIAVSPEPGSDRLQIVIDADASTGIANFDFEHLTPDQRRNLLYEGPGLVYNVRPGGKTAIIGPGGGWDVSRALASGSKDITGVEINPIIVNNVMKGQFASASRNLYFRPEVKIQVEDGRSFIQRSSERYQILQATLVDTWASTAAGAFALSENNLYTREAFLQYLSHLTDDGVLSFTRWGFEPPRESLRLISLAMWALEQLGEKDPGRHIIVGREGDKARLAGWGARDTVLISRKPFTDQDLQRARDAIAQSHMEAVYMPGAENKNQFGELLRSPNPAEYQRTYQYNITPVEDDQPFFFYTVQPRDIWNFVTAGNTASADYKINRAVPLLFGLVAVSILATMFILALPPVLLGSRLPSDPEARRFLLYFLCIGVGYILIQVALIQKFILFLGQPTYALTVIIFSMLLSSGLGSYFSRRFLQGSDQRLRLVLVTVSVLVALLAFTAPAITNAGMVWPLAVKFLVTTLLISPLGFAMGMPFPTGLARLEAQHAPSVRWAWSLNAASSVMGSAGAIFLAIYVGLRMTLLIGGGLYLCALLVVLWTGRQRAMSARVPASAIV